MFSKHTQTFQSRASLWWLCSNLVYGPRGKFQAYCERVLRHLINLKSSRHFFFPIVGTVSSTGNKIPAVYLSWLWLQFYNMGANPTIECLLKLAYAKSSTMNNGLSDFCQKVGILQKHLSSVIHMRCQRCVVGGEYVYNSSLNSKKLLM